ERLHTEAVSRPEQSALATVVDDERPHPVQAVQAVRAPVPIGREQDFGVAGGAETVSRSPQLVAQLDVVVDLTVEDDDELAVIGGHWLLTGRAQVKDGQSTKTEPHLAVDVHT